MDGLPWDVSWYDPLVGFAVLPGLTVAAALFARRRGAAPIRVTGPGGHLLNGAVIISLLLNPYTAAGAALFYGTTMLVAAWRRQAGCETTAISNLLTGRDDEIACPLFLPVDAAEAALRGRRERRPRATGAAAG